MKVYTKRGDQGETDIYKGGRVPKTDPRVEACGWIDSLSVELGMVRAMAGHNSRYAILEAIQRDLIGLGAFVSSMGKGQPPGNREKEMEAAIDKIDADLPVMKEFVIPGNSMLEVQLHRARVTCRTAERRVVQASMQQDGNPLKAAIVYLNRLSDLLFVMARREAM